MNDPKSLDGLPIDKVRQILAADNISVAALEVFLANTQNPEIRKLILAAIARLLANTRIEVARKKEELTEAEQRQKKIEAILRQHAADQQDYDDRESSSPSP